MASESSPPFKQQRPIRGQRAFELICDTIRQRLSDGLLKPGDKLPAERELSRQLHVSRATIREAIRSLEIAGIVYQTKGVKGGAFIREGSPDQIAKTLQDYMSLGSISLEELTEARIFIQDIVVQLAVERATEEQFATLRRIVEKTRAVTSVQERYSCAADFYRTLALSTGNRVLGMFVESVTQILGRFVRTPGYPTLQEELLDSRERFLKLLEQRDAEGAKAEMRTHLNKIHAHVHKFAGSKAGKEDAS
ncbi:MAG: FadR family transcriptional regulator [Rhodobiaceae bacterium]|nr:FadR family transcriptional regulator [Rhodobiaceae bacterium]MCC0054571.1 FadR family transcriptional regulator [Rhodobiaceae bacterium]